MDPSGHNKKRWNTFKDIEKESKKRGKKYKKARKCIKRYKKNVSAMSKTDYPVKTGYVYGQNAYLTIKFRKTNIADDGCGIVATHNAMHALGSKGIFNKLVTEFDYNMVLSGKTGIAYGTLRKCLAEHGYTTKRYLRVTSFDKNIKANQPGILETPYHYVMIKRSGKRIKCYNVSGNMYTAAEMYDSVSDLLDHMGETYFMGLIVKK